MCLGAGECRVNLSGLLPLIQETPPYRQLVRAVEAGDPQPLLVGGGEGETKTPDLRRGLGIITPARPYLVAALYRQLRRPILLLTARAERVSQWSEQLCVWTGCSAVLPFPEPDALPYERVPWSRETVSDRLAALTALVRWREQTETEAEQGGTPSTPEPPLLIASARSLMHKTLPVREFRLGVREYRRGQTIDLQRTLGHWVANGYRPETVVEEPGTFSRRGGLIDVFPSNLPGPVRIELFGDEIDSLRVFEPTTQRSAHQIEQFCLSPATEALPRLAASGIQRARGTSKELLDLSLCHPPARMEFQQDLVALEQGASFRGIEFYLPLFYSHPASLLDYLPANGVCIVEDWPALSATIVDLDHQAQTLQADLIRAGELPANWPEIAAPYFAWDQLEEGLEAVEGSRLLVLAGGAGKGGHGQETDPSKTFAHQGEGAEGLGQETFGQPGQASAHPGEPVTAPRLSELFAYGERYGGQLKKVLDGCQEMRTSGMRVILVSRQARRISELLAEREITANPVEDVAESPPTRSLTLVQGTLAEGWTLDGVTLLTDAEIFGWARPAARRARRIRPVAPEAFFADVEPGSYVVHVEHGIGLFRGLTKMGIQGGEREYLLVEYAAGDKLYLPVYQADRLSRYVGIGEEAPEIHRLGTADWARVKESAQKAVAEIADDLLALYAAREVVDGHAFSADTFWQAELEASFPYVETEAQLRTLDEIKTDMEQPRPMDRLVCGDVGYGKTEVALRAAFKAVMDGKQVAILVPTTVLAQQHYQTFSQRLAAFPVTVKMLSRFLSHRQQQQVILGLRDGGVDIVIGTHRLLSTDVVFKDLGLLVIDEEQRFGVGHKERLKQMRQQVDVLTLTATPIPRTLHMSLTGVRDMSTIDTPPEERLPVRTHVGEYDETLIRQAILRELDRDGQVYFVHNRVMGIYQMSQRVRKLVPEVSIAVGHGQMAERELESVMLEFAAGHVDVLVCTSIIESGLDIPNANTLIVNRADQFGLAQLYQLRGRVGRGARRAYAYFLHPKASSLSEQAKQRFETLSEATELGAGFRIAMRDLEIRGAGDLLGSRQHGHIAAVGFDLYTRLLAQAVQEARHRQELGGKPTPKSELEEETAAYVQPLEQTVQISLPLAAYLPESYVPDGALRLQLYRRLAGLTSEEEIADLRTELQDRFGTPPEEAENLFYQLQLKLLALAAGVKAINTEEEQIVVRADSLEEVDRTWLQRRLGERARVARRAVWLPLEAEERWRTTLLAVLQAIVEGIG
jgi:transcription-repair coupling factor (superfamily II helicase)